MYKAIALLNCSADLLVTVALSKKAGADAEEGVKDRGIVGFQCADPVAQSSSARGVVEDGLGILTMIPCASMIHMLL